MVQSLYHKKNKSQKDELICRKVFIKNLNKKEQRKNIKQIVVHVQDKSKIWNKKNYQNEIQEFSRKTSINFLST